MKYMLIVLALLLSTNANAGAGLEQCKLMGELSYSIALLRDIGIKKENVEAEIIAAGVDTSNLKETIAFLTEQTYGNGINLPSEILKNIVLKTCIENIQ